MKSGKKQREVAVVGHRRGEVSSPGGRAFSSTKRPNCIVEYLNPCLIGAFGPGPTITS